MNKIYLIITLATILICTAYINWKQQKQMEEQMEALMVMKWQIESLNTEMSVDLGKIKKDLSFVSGDASTDVINELKPILEEIESRHR